MITPPLQVTEPCRPLPFASRARLWQHVIKHVFMRWGEERWRNLLPLDPAVAAAARQDWHAGLWKTHAFRQVAKAYWQVCAKALCDLCVQRRHHIHLIKYRLPEDIEELRSVSVEDFPAQAQCVYGWDESGRLFLVAASLVQEGGQRPYKLKTGYRPDDRQDLGRFRSKARAWINHALEFGTYRMLARHED